MTPKAAKVDPKTEGFEKKLRKKCPKCSDASIKVYLRNAKRLWKLVGEGEIPANGAWLSNEKLFSKFKGLTAAQKRSLSVAGVKASQAYGLNVERWNTLMYKTQNQYIETRNKNVKSDVEKEKWPKGGFASLKKAAVEMKKRIRHVIRDKPTLQGLYQYQLFITLKLFQDLPFRNNFADMKISKGDGNYIDVPQKGNIKFVMRRFKGSDKIGEREIPLGRANTIQLKKFLKYRAELGLKHPYLLSTQSGKKMSRPTLSKALHKITKVLLGKSLGSRQIRVMFATANKEAIDKASEVADKMLHVNKPTQTKQYTRK